MKCQHIGYVRHAPISHPKKMPLAPGLTLLQYTAISSEHSLRSLGRSRMSCGDEDEDRQVPAACANSGCALGRCSFPDVANPQVL